MAYVDSLIGYIAGSLTDPTGARDSLIGYVAGVISEAGVNNESSIGFISGVVRNPHHPIGVWDGTSMRYVPVWTWDGTSLRSKDKTITPQ